MKWLAARPLWVKVLAWTYAGGYVAYLAVIGVLLWPVGVRDWLFVMSFQAIDALAWPILVLLHLIGN